MKAKFKESMDRGNAFRALLTDLSKAFDCIDHTLFIAKLSAFGVSPLSLKLIYSYLSNRTQRIKINENSNVASYADDTTPYSCATEILSVALELQVTATKLFR